MAIINSVISGGGGQFDLNLQNKKVGDYQTKIYFKDFTTTTLSSTATSIVPKVNASDFGITISSSYHYLGILEYYACFKYLDNTVTTLGISYPTDSLGYAIIYTGNTYYIQTSGSSSAGYKMTCPYLQDNPSASTSNYSYFASVKPYPYNHFLYGVTSDGTKTARCWSTPSTSNSIFGIYPYSPSSITSTTVVPAFYWRCISASGANQVNFPTTIGSYIDFDNSFLTYKESVYAFESDPTLRRNAELSLYDFVQTNKDEHFPQT